MPYISLKRSAGYTLIEQALVLPILLVFIFGAIDVSNTMQAYNALQEGVRTSLRCTYTVDGECIDVPTSSVSPLFNWYQITSSDSGDTYGYRYHYEGTEKYIQLPVYAWSNFEGRYLTSYHHDVQQYNREAHQRWFQAQGTVPGFPVHQARAPQVEIFSPHQANFRYKNSPNQTYENNIPVTYLDGDKDDVIAGVTGAINTSDSNPNNDERNWTVRFRVDNPHQGPGCKKSQHFNEAVDEPIASNNDCNADAQVSGNIVIWVRANSNGSDNNAVGVIDIQLDGADINGPGNNSLDLGGREYTYHNNQNPHDASLYPRGVPEGFLIDSDPNGGDEAAIYNNVRINFGQNYRLKFKLREAADEPDTNGKIKFNLQNIRIFRPRFASTSGTTVECVGGLLPSEFENPSACTPPQGEVITHVDVINQHAFPHNYISTGSSISLKPSAHGGTLNESELNNRLNALGISSSEWVNYFETPNSGQFQETHFSEGCLNGIGESSGGLAPNYGVAQQPDGDGYVTTNNAYAICPPQGTSNQEAFPPADQGTIVNVKWLTAMAPIPGNPSIDWTRTNCNQAQPPQVPTEVALYHHHDDGEITFSHYAEEHIYTGPENAPENDPDYVVANDPLYNCSDYSPSFTVGSKDYNKNMENLPDESLFASLVNELGCDWEDVVRDEAISLGMNSAAFFEASFADQTITQLTGEPAECATFWEDPGEPNDGDLIEVAGNPYPSGVVPAECEHSACHVEFIGFDGDGSGGAGEVEIDLEKAAQDYGFETIRAFYPRASWNCEDNDCVNLDVAYEGQSMVSRGTVQVPMNLLLGESVELSYEEAETFEGELAR